VGDSEIGPATTCLEATACQLWVTTGDVDSSRTGVAFGTIEQGVSSTNCTKGTHASRNETFAAHLHSIADASWRGAAIGNGRSLSMKRPIVACVWDDAPTCVIEDQQVHRLQSVRTLDENNAGELGGPGLQKMNTLIVVGARPNFMKAASIIAGIHELNQRKTNRHLCSQGPIQHVLVHTVSTLRRPYVQRLFPRSQAPEPGCSP
jgi:hypothetical protein